MFECWRFIYCTAGNNNAPALFRIFRGCFSLSPRHAPPPLSCHSNSKAWPLSLAAYILLCHSTGQHRRKKRGKGLCVYAHTHIRTKRKRGPQQFMFRHQNTDGLLCRESNRRALYYKHEAKEPQGSLQPLSRPTSPSVSCFA